MRELGIIVAVLIMAAAAAASRRRGRTLPPLVLLVGDSLAQGLGPPLTRLLAARGVTLQSVAVKGSTARDWRREFLARALDTSQARLVIVSLGGNDSASHILSVEFPGNVVTLARRLKAAKRDVVWLMTTKPSPQVRWTLEQPEFDCLPAPLGMQLDKTGHPLGSGYERWAAAIVASFT
jgi:GDSL-like Lipase/Acylhydrolase family